MKYFKLEHFNDKYKITEMYNSPLVNHSLGTIIVNEDELSRIKPELIVNIDRYIQNK